MMSFKDQLFIVRNRIFEKRNIIFIIVLTIICLILFTCLTIIQFSIENKKAILNSENERTYKIYHEVIDDDINHTLRDVEFTEEQIETIKNLEHVESIVNEKYYFGSRTEVSAFNKESEEGILVLKVLLNKEDIKIKKGTNLEDKYELVCSNIFYPHEFDNRMYRDLFIPSSEFLGKEIEVISSNEDLDGKKISLQIVGTYENKYMETANTCYTDMATYDEIVSKYGGSIESYDEKGNLIEKEYREYRDYLVRIDSKENVEEVLTALDDMGIEYGRVFYMDSGFLNLLYFIPLFVGVVVILLTFSILYNFIVKKNMNKLSSIGILKAIGYDEKNITSLMVYENIVVVILSYIFSLFFYLIVLHYFTYTLLAEVTYNNYILNVPYLFIVVSFVAFVFVIYVIVKLNLKKIFQYNVQELLFMK